MARESSDSAETELDLGRWLLTEESARRYLAAVDDDLDLYFKLGLAPPLALSAYALGALLEKLELPAGTIHSIQEMDTLLPTAIGSQISGTAVIERPRRRGALRFITATYTLKNGAGATVQTGKTTVLAPATDAAGPVNRPADSPDPAPDPSPDGAGS